jgi:predicted peroxiredoxin
VYLILCNHLVWEKSMIKVNCSNSLGKSIDIMIKTFIVLSYFSIKMKILLIISLIVTFSLSLFIVMSNTITVLQRVNGQDLENTDEKLYVLLFEQNKIGNIDNSTKIVSAIVGNNLIKIEEELLEEISLAPSQQLKEQMSEIIKNGTSGLSCNASLATEDGDNVGIDCISSGKHIIWHIYPK